MLRLKDIKYARKRKKIWDLFRWGYKSENQLSKRHSLKCNCSLCKSLTSIKHQENRKKRHIMKKELEEILRNL